MGELETLNNARRTAASELRDLADEVERGELHGVVAAAVYSDEVAADQNKATASFHWVAEDKTNPWLMRLALGGMLHELASRLFGFVNWQDLDEL